MIAINLSSAFHTTHHALPGMKKRNWGRIINIASVHGLVASTQNAAYVVAKYGIVGLTKVTALENARTGITCNAIYPGWVLIPLVQKQVDARAESDGISNDAAKTALVSEKQPSGEFVSHEQLAALKRSFCVVQTFLRFAEWLGIWMAVGPLNKRSNPKSVECRQTSLPDFSVA
jgi:3-hydroxybutyrate dehydrogenase